MRGEIHSTARAQQLRDYSMLILRGKSTPSDIDGIIEFDGRFFWILELKHIGNEIENGQEMMLERLCDALCDAGKMAVVFLAYHDQPVHEAIQAHKAVIRKYRFKKAWHTPKFQTTVLEGLRIFYKMYSPL